MIGVKYEQEAGFKLNAKRSINHTMVLIRAQLALDRFSVIDS